MDNQVRKEWLRSEIGVLEAEQWRVLEPGWAGKTVNNLPVNKLRYLEEIYDRLKAHRRELWQITRDEWVVRFKRFWGANV